MRNHVLMDGKHAPIMVIKTTEYPDLGTMELLVSMPKSVPLEVGVTLVGNDFSGIIQSWKEAGPNRKIILG